MKGQGHKVVNLSHFWATVCKTVRPVLLDHCPVCLFVCLSDAGVLWTKVGWIKMKLGMQVGLGPGHTVLEWRPSSPHGKGHSNLHI